MKKLIVVIAVLLLSVGCTVVQNAAAHPEVKPKTPGECIAYYEGQQGMNYSVINGCMSAVYKRQGGALKLVSWGDGVNNVNEKVWGKKSQ